MIGEFGFCLFFGGEGGGDGGQGGRTFKISRDGQGYGVPVRTDGPAVGTGRRELLA